MPLLDDLSMKMNLISSCHLSQVLLRDTSDENVIPVLEELQRRLPVGNEARGQGDAKECSGAQNDGDTGEEDGTTPIDFWLF